MSIGLYISGMSEPDEEFRKLKAVYDACKAADVLPENYPPEVEHYFGGYEPEDLMGKDIDIDAAIIKGDKYMSTDFTVDITLLPPGVKYIRFWMS